MKEWPNKILITSEKGFDKFIQDAMEFIEANDILHEPFEIPSSYPCLIVGNVFSYEENDGYCHWTRHELRSTCVYLKDFN